MRCCQNCLSTIHHIIVNAGNFEDITNIEKNKMVHEVDDATTIVIKSMDTEHEISLKRTLSIESHQVPNS